MATIEAYAQPPRLYRYRSLKKFEQELRAIEQGYLFCADFTALNDPMEGLFTSSRRLREKEDYRLTRQAILDKKAQIGMCCFCEVKNHELMWAHYADQFSGICVSYSLSKLLESLPDNVSLVRMFYDETEPTLHRSRLPHDNLAKMILSYKNHRWLYEREWRLFSPHKGEVYYRDKDCITTVYLGSRISEEHRQAILPRLSAFNIKSRNMVIKKYSVDFEKE